MLEWRYHSKTQLPDDPLGIARQCNFGQEKLAKVNNLAEEGSDPEKVDTSGVRPINIDVLIIDDFMTMSINQREQEDLAKIIFDREARLPTVISSQSAAAYRVAELPETWPPLGRHLISSPVGLARKVIYHHA